MKDSAEQFAECLGYKLEHVCLSDMSPAKLKQQTRILQARGVRGIILGPFKQYYATLDFPWDDMCWVSIGANFIHPQVYWIGRDFQSDIMTGLDWLADRGVRRPAFIDYAGFIAHMQPIFKQAAYQYMHEQHLDALPYHEIDDLDCSMEWIDTYQPDGVILLASLPQCYQPLSQRFSGMPMVLLSTPQVHNLEPNQLTFRAAFEAIGQAAVNVLHRQLRNGSFGLAEYRQSVTFSSHRTDHANDGGAA